MRGDHDVGHVPERTVRRQRLAGDDVQSSAAQVTMAQRSQRCARWSATISGQRRAKYSMTNTTNSARATEWRPAAFVTTIGLSTMASFLTHSPIPELLAWIQRNFGTRLAKSDTLGP